MKNCNRSGANILIANLSDFLASRADITGATKQLLCAQDTFKAILFRVKENTEHGHHVGRLDDFVPQPTYLMGISLMLYVSMDVLSNNKLQ